MEKNEERDHVMVDAATAVKEYPAVNIGSDEISEIEILGNQFTAIDNMVAWQHLTLLPDGTILATVFNQPSHGRCEGDIDCWASTDGGKKWEFRSRVSEHDPGTNRQHQATGLARSGDVISITTGWTNPQPGARQGTSLHVPLWVCRSSDSGHAWEVDKSAVTTPDDVKTGMSPWRSIVRCSGGRLAASFYGDGEEAERYNTCYILFSEDDGRTWGKKGTVRVSKDISETAVLPLNSGRWLAVGRDDWHGDSMLLLVSEDHAKTWQVNGRISHSKEHPGDLIQLMDGRILLSYGRRIVVGRHAGLTMEEDRTLPRSIRIRVSRDEGRSWEPPQNLVSLKGATHDCGYPTTIQLADGTMVTVYYTGGIGTLVPRYADYRMEVVRWRFRNT